MPTAELQPIVDRASPIVTTVTGLVNTGFSTAQGYAHTAFGTAVDTLDEME